MHKLEFTVEPGATALGQTGYALTRCEQLLSVPTRAALRTILCELVRDTSRSHAGCPIAVELEIRSPTSVRGRVGSSNGGAVDARRASVIDAAGDCGRPAAKKPVDGRTGAVAGDDRAQVALRVLEALTERWGVDEADIWFELRSDLDRLAACEHRRGWTLR